MQQKLLKPSGSEVKVYTADNIKWYSEHPAPWGRTIFTYWKAYLLPAVVNRFHKRRDGRGVVTHYSIQGGYSDVVFASTVDDMLAIVNEYNRLVGDSDEYVRIFGVCTERHMPTLNSYNRYTDEEQARLPVIYPWQKGRHAGSEKEKAHC